MGTSPARFGVVSRDCFPDQVAAAGRQKERVRFRGPLQFLLPPRGAVIERSGQVRNNAVLAEIPRGLLPGPRGRWHWPNHELCAIESERSANCVRQVCEWCRTQPKTPDTSRQGRSASRCETACVTVCPATLPPDLVTPLISVLSMTALSWIHVQSASSVMTTSSDSFAHSAPNRKCHTAQDDASRR